MEGTKGDKYTKEMIERIFNEGCLDKNPRPHYEDIYEEARYNKYTNEIITKAGLAIPVKDNQTLKIEKNRIVVHTPAHTLSVNHAMMTYDLDKGESPLITLRPIAVKTSISEFLWIYQKASDDLVEFDELLNKNTWDENHTINNWWDEWALRDEAGKYILNEEGHPTIGHCYGSTVRDHELLKTLIEGIKNDPDGRRHMISLWQVDDFKKPHGLKPCAFLTMWNVRHGKDGVDYLDMCLTQRSSDFLTAGSINQFQYVVLQHCIARHLNLTPGRFTWFIDNVQIYDRHVKQGEIMLNREPIDCEPKVEINPEKTDFYDITPDDIKVLGYPRKQIQEKNPQLKFQLGI